MAHDAKKMKKPKGFRAFDALARKLVKVPKSEVERGEGPRQEKTE